MRVIATAGHVDHGKSTLVRALTGIEPDRWAEEKQRGLTIDLGYAWATIAGEELAFVDVPGHSRFIGNMLAGLGPSPAVMLCVAADEGWRQQSTEHLDAARALGIAHGVLVITRSDLADPADALVQAREHLAGTPLAGMEAVAVSAHTGAGLDALHDALARLIVTLPAPCAEGRLRLWVDRAFTITGAGTVVTGTLESGRVAVGDTLLLDGREVGVRSLESLGRRVPAVDAVARVALNLRGVPTDTVKRGDVLLRGPWHHTTTADVRLDAEVPTHVTAHVGTAAIPVRVRPLDATHARLTWERPLPLATGDRLVLREPSVGFVGGALVLDVDPPALARRGAARARAAALATMAGRLDPRVEVARRGLMRTTDLDALGGDPARSGAIAHAGWLADPAHWDALAARLVEVVDAHAAAHPLQARMPARAASEALALPDARLLAPLASHAGLEAADGHVARPGARADLGPAEAALQQLERRWQTEPFAAPEADELAAWGLGRRELAAAERLGRVLTLAEGIVVTPKAPALAMRELARLPQPFTAAQAKKAWGTTRRVAIPLLEQLDRRGWTRRVDGTLREVVR